MKKFIHAAGVLLLLATACGGKKQEMPQEPIHDEMNSVYYWKTTFAPDSADKAFMERHDIDRVYLRMFDVIADRNETYPGKRAIPNATVRISDEDYLLLKEQMKEKEFVPTVYITLDALKEVSGHEGVLAENIVRRVKNMCSYNELPNVGELQLDCDWTGMTRESFFNLCDSVRISIAKEKLDWRLSSTVRLHQLRSEVPPVDCGVLMVYNTGSFNDPDAANSIIDPADVKPYIEHLASYPLHLDVAYPTYSWQLLFRKRQFIGLLNGIDLQDSTQFSRREKNTYEAINDIASGGRLIHKGDIVRQETSSIDDILKTKQMIEKELAFRPHSTILYHLDSSNLSKYTSNEIDSIYS